MKTLTINLAVPFALALVSSLGHAATLSVPAPYPTIQLAVNAASPGDVVEIAGGTYFEHVNVTGKTDVTIQARGSDVVTVDASGVGYPLYVHGFSDRVRVRNLRLQNTSTYGVAIATTTNVRIENCEVSLVGADGVRALWNDGLLIKRCTILHPGGDGIYVYESGARLLKNTIVQPGSDGITMIGGANSAEQNAIEGCGASGIVVGDAADATGPCLVFKNVVNDTTQEGIWVRTLATGCSVMENRIKRAGYDGIQLDGASTGHMVFKNRISRASLQGLEISSDDNTAQKNKIKKAGVDGIMLYSSATQNMLQKNKVRKSLGDGIEVSGTNNTFMNNSASGSAFFDLRDNTPVGANSYYDNSFLTVAP